MRINFLHPASYDAQGYNRHMPLDSRQMTQPLTSDTREGLNEVPQKILALKDGLEQAYRYYWSEGQSHFFYRQGIGSVHARSFIEERNENLLFISPGRAESSLKYAELALELKGSGFDLVVLDHRGQGFSERYFGIQGFGHVCDFNKYSDDFIEIYNHFTEKKNYKNKICLAHSMGSAIALTSQIRGEGLFDGMILSSPMLKVRTGKLPVPLATLSVEALCQTMWQRKPVNRNESRDQREAFVNNLNTTCSHRFQFFRELERRHPQVSLGAPTYGWLKEALRMGRFINKNRQSLGLGILLMQAEQDGLVCNRAQDQFAHEVNNCRLIRLKEARHEILQERDSIRNRALVQIHKFLKEYK